MDSDNEKYIRREPSEDNLENTLKCQSYTKEVVKLLTFLTIENLKS